MTFSYQGALCCGLFVAAVALVSPPIWAQQEPAGLAIEGTASISDAFRLPAPSQVQPGGLIGQRFNLSEQNRLLKVNEDELLGGFRHRPGSHPWIGEHIGKWLHAASLTYACTHDEGLRDKLDRVAMELIKTQEADGYLGTYSVEKRFGLFQNADWDVWSHKYDLIGLLTYYQYTNNKDALETCKRIGDLLINTFGPGKKSILSAGTHLGMAATSVLEPVVLLYRATGDKRYLDFAEYIVASWEEEGGPRVLSSLLNGNPVNKVANGKAYEMTSNLVGLCELYRATGKKEYLDAVLNGWKDIAANRLYITGSGSSHEVWQADYHLPNDEAAQICETCVTVTWMQLNIQLLRLEGDAKFAEEIEKTLFNHLLGAQKPTGDDWAYYTPLQGRKPYDSSTNCCHSSGPRGVALAPSFLYAATDDGVAVNVFSASKAAIHLATGGDVKLEQQTDYPLDGQVKLEVHPVGASDPFAIHLRVPAWSPHVSVAVNGKPVSSPEVKAGYVVVKQQWNPGDTITYTIDMARRAVLGDHENNGRMALMYGPLVLAMDLTHNTENGVLLANFAPAIDAGMSNSYEIERVKKAGADDVPLFETRGIMFRDIADQAGATRTPSACKLFFTPYYAVGGDKSPFCVWMKRPSSFTPTPASRFSGAEETRSRAGNVSGSIADGDDHTFVVTFDGTKRAEDWFALALLEAVKVSRVVFVQGKLFHDGGWFDASAGKPRIQIRKTKDSPWENLACINDYPATTATDPAGLKDFQRFELKLGPASATAIRVIGQPACGDNPGQAFSSCAEFEAF